METASASGGKRRLKEKMAQEVVEEEEEETEDESTEDSGFEDDRRKKASGGRRGSFGGGAPQPCCQVDNCTADLTYAKPYHKRHKVCEFHAKVPVAVILGFHQRFCQQCSRFHAVQEFDDTKRSCRRRLAGHNERRRKSQGDGSG